MIKAQIETHFPIVLTNGCLQTISDIEFGISETEEKESKIVEHDGADFQIKNPLLREINFWAIDGCTFSSNVSQGKRCDFGIFDNETFAFTELKSSSIKQRKAARVNAQNQLSKMLENCQGKLDFKGVKLLAIIAFKLKKSEPAAKTKRQDAELSFFNKYRAQLLEGNSLTFPFTP